MDYGAFLYLCMHHGRIGNKHCSICPFVCFVFDKIIYYVFEQWLATDASTYELTTIRNDCGFNSVKDGGGNHLHMINDGEKPIIFISIYLLCEKRIRYFCDYSVVSVFVSIS